MASSRPNVILLSIDALRADHLSCYGYERRTMPTIDRLAEENALFTRAYSASSHTREAIPALLTGRYPDEAVDQSYHLRTDTIAAHMTGAGLATGAFHSNPFISRAYGFDQDFDAFDDDLRLGQHRFLALVQRAFDKLRNRHYARADEINRRSLDWIDSLDDRPFFLWNHYMDAHGPYEPPEPYVRMFADSSVLKRTAQNLYKRAIRDPESITDEEQQLLIDLYDGELRYVDEKVGTFIEELTERGLLEDTLLIVTADHGEVFGEHGYYEHPRYPFDELVHVPLVIRGPGVPQSTHKTAVSTLDIVPTAADAIGYMVDDFPGTPLQRRWDDEPADADRYVFSHASTTIENRHFRRFSVHDGERSCWLEFVSNGSAYELADDARPPDSELGTVLYEHALDRLRRDEAPIADRAEAERDIEPEVDQRLEALGYKE